MKAFAETIRSMLGRLSETGLEWWVDLVKDEFRFLENYGFEVKEVHLDFLGNYVRYQSPTHEVVVAYEPESTGALEATIERRTAGEPSPVVIETLIRKRTPGVPLPPKTPLSRSVVTTVVQFWATNLRQMSDELFSNDSI